MIQLHALDVNSWDPGDVFHLGQHLARCFERPCPCLQLWKLTQMAPSVLIGILAGACWSNDVRVAKTAVQALASVTHCLLAAGAECMPCTREMLALHAGSKAADLLNCSALAVVGSFWSLERQPRSRASSTAVAYRNNSIPLLLHRALPEPQSQVTIYLV